MRTDDLKTECDRLGSSMDAVAAMARREPYATRLHDGAIPGPTANFIEACLTNACEGMKLFPSEVYTGHRWKWRANHEVNWPLIRRQSREWSPVLWGTIQAIENGPTSGLHDGSAEAWLDQLRGIHDWLFGDDQRHRAGCFRTRPVVIGTRSLPRITPHHDLIPELLRWAHRRIASAGDETVQSVLTEYVVTTIHPFEDGNGRVSRLAGNAGLKRRRIPLKERFYEYCDALSQLQDRPSAETAETWIEVVTDGHSAGNALSDQTIPEAILQWCDVVTVQPGRIREFWWWMVPQERPTRAGPAMPPAMIRRYHERRTPRITEWGIR